jgi:copper chaperone CopZ
MTEMTKTIHITGMSCAHCSGRVQKALAALPGVGSVTVDLAMGTATLRLTEPVPDDVLRATVDDAGYDVTGISG